MESYLYKPQSILSRYVDFFWIQDGYCPPSDREKVLPNGSVQLIINLDDIPFRVFRDDNGTELDRSVVTGSQSGPIILDSQSRKSTLGVHFRSGGILPVLSVKARELKETPLSLKSILGSSITDELYNNLIKTDLPLAKCKLLEQYLIRSISTKYDSHRSVKFAVPHLMTNPIGNSIHELSKRTGLSEKRFTEVFHDEVGLTPKLFSRIHRFQKILGRLNEIPKVNYSQIAYDFGYFDQSHMIRDFKSLSGMTPGQYRLLKPQEKNHIPI